MTSLKQVLIEALKSLLRGRTFLSALLAFWLKPTNDKDNMNGKAKAPKRTIEDFLKEAEKLLLEPIERDELKRMSVGIKKQFRERLHCHPVSMLPSYNYLLPTGKEKGQFLALDVGGSTLRVALVELRGREATGRESEIVRMRSFKITPELKQLEGMAFFDWMAERIFEVIKENESYQADSTSPIPMGLAWSFPIDQTSLEGGLLIGMGKGFKATNGLIGQDLGDVIKFACKKTGLNVQLKAIINDSSATLLSQAYIHASTRFGLILGTGCNMAVHLPVTAFNREKFGKRPESWFKSATHVITNTELSMFGGGVLPLTRWDQQLKAKHPMPDYQPLEQCVSGYYLGEICRLALVEAVQETGLLGGVLPPSLEEEYSLDTATLSAIEADTSPTFETALPLFATAHPSSVKPTIADMTAIRTLASYISRRSAALLATAVFSMWELRHEAEAERVASPVKNDDAPVAVEAETENTLPRTKVAFNGSVIEHYPQYRSNCQHYIDDLVGSSPHPGSMDLVPALESSLMGAAVALACGTAE